MRRAVGDLAGIFVSAVDAVAADGGGAVRAATSGARVPTPDEVARVQKQVSQATGTTVQVSLWAQTDVLVQASGYAPLGSTGESGEGGRR